MICQRASPQAELKSTRQLVVRFLHAPCVKLTLQPGVGGPLSPGGVRVLRLQKAADAVAR